MQTDIDKDLLAYFTNVEHLRDTFKQKVTAPVLTKRLLIIHGVGGVGKSSLLRMFRLHCKSVNVFVALASGDEAKSALDVLARWADDLKADSVAFPLFSKTYEQYRAIQAKVDEQAKKAQHAGGRMADIAGKAASKTAEAAGGALAGAAIGSAIPGVGTAIGGVLGGVLGGMGAEVLVDWLRGFLTRPDIDLLLDPTSKLTSGFLGDVAKVAEKKRLVLMLDTFEQMTALEEWARDVAQRLHTNVLLVIAGRALPNWNRAWSGWMANAQVEELKPMTEDVMRDLVRRYYAAIRGGEPNPVQVEAIIRFARGLPMVVTSAVQLWVKYGVEDFQSVKTEIVANLVDRLMEGVPKRLIPALEAAAIVRWFDQPTLRAVTELADVRDVYNELRRFPFVRVRVEGLALHDAVREIMDENLRVQDSERHRELHEHAATYFEKRLGKATGEEAGRLGLEQLYHLIRADEETGIKLFQEMGEKLARYHFVGRLRLLMNDVNTYPLNSPSNQLWRDYYNARLLHISLRSSEAEELYEKISENKLAESRLRAYALCDLSQLWTSNSRLSQPGGLEKACSAIERSRQLYPNMDSKLALNLLHLRYVYMFKGELDTAADALRQQYEFHKRIGDDSGTVYTLDMLKDLYGLLGNWKMAVEAEKEGLGILDTMPSNSFLLTRLIGHNIWHKIWSGQYSEAERGMRRALALAEAEEQVDSIPGLCRDLGLVLGLQRRWEQSKEQFSASVKIYKEWGGRNTSLGGTLGFWGSILARQKEFSKAEEYLTGSLSNKKELPDNNGIPEILVWLGEMYEMKAKEAKGEERNRSLSQAGSYYEQCLDYRWTSRRYFECTALTGLVRVKFAVNETRDAVNLFAQAERIAGEYQYHDLMASLHLIKGHIQWSGPIEAWPGGFDAASLSYKRAMLHALKYNRFLLDEVLWGDRVSTPLIDIISQCSLRGSEGQTMLEVLVNWWESGKDDLAPEVSNNALLFEANSIPLTQAERLARHREPGDGAIQPTVKEILKRFLV